MEMESSRPWMVCRRWIMMVMILLAKLRWPIFQEKLLGAMGLEDRCVTLNGTNILPDIDYSYVNEKKEALLIESKQFIKEALCDE